jgi:hypothetical protein
MVYKRTARKHSKSASKSRRKRGGDDIETGPSDARLLEEGRSPSPPPPPPPTFPLPMTEAQRMAIQREQLSRTYDLADAAEKGELYHGWQAGGRRRRRKTNKRKSSKRGKKHSNKTYKKKSLFDQLFGL